MRDRILTFLYLPDGASEPRTLQVRRSIVVTLVTSVLFALGVSGWMVLHYATRLKNAYQVEVLETQNKQLRDDMTSLETELGTLRRQVAQNFDFQKKARILANLDDVGDDVTEVGVGGPAADVTQAIQNLDPATRDRLLGARDDIDKLLRQARLQKEDYETILAKMEAANQEVHTTPSLKPVALGFISSRFGWRMDPITGRRTMHRGVDFSARLGTSVMATADGVVTYSGVWQTYGNVVELSHGNGFVTRYCHLQRRLVEKGQKVTRGDIIGRVGSTGRSTFSHLHYEIEQNGERIDPLRYVLMDLALP